MRKFVIAALLIGVLLIMGGLRASDLWSLRTETLASSEARAANLALILSEYLSESFSAADATLRQLQLHSHRIGGATAGAGEWRATLESAAVGLTGVGSLSVVDAQGIIRHSTLRDIIGQSRTSNQLYMRAKDSKSNELLVGAPLESPVFPGIVVIPIARRLARADGSFEGLVVASFQPARPRGFIRTVNVGERGVIWVFHPDGVVMFREPSHDDPIGQPALDNPVFKAAIERRAPGVLRDAVVAGGPEMLTAFHRGGQAPLIVAVSLDRDETLADWSRLALGAAITYTLAGVMVIASMFVLFRQMNQREATERELAHTRQVEAARLRDANERLEATLEREKRARRDAEEANSLKDHFVMMVSHELRTPLTAIAGWARMLVDGMVSADKRDAALHTIERNAQAQKRLIEDLLDVSGIMSGKLRLDMRQVAVAEVVKLALDAIKPAVDAKHIELETTIDPAVGIMTADPERLQQVIWNLLSNAVKFTPAGGRVSIDMRRPDDDVQIVVRDTGAGISPEFLPHVFERFRQASPGTARHHGGLGLGLTIVRNLVELHGGSVTAQSDGLGHGATFIVRLPASVTLPAATAVG